mmetsp:Transcript_26001/g.72531  ORF Transcript_26001/g.72531 Transcript_26001/m.72531 type:complete len:389 (+) Transcript_26001:356-1522(+)
MEKLQVSAFTPTTSTSSSVMTESGACDLEVDAAAAAAVLPPSILLRKKISDVTMEEEGSAHVVVDPEKSLLHKLNIADGSDHSVSRPWVVGHRGALYDELENTREGFNHCANMGCDAVELDVFALEDGSVIVFHGAGNDRNPGLLQEYCNVPGSILDMKTFEETQRLTFNPNFAEFPCAPDKILSGKIPKLDDVLLDAKKSGLHLKIELKGAGTVQPTLDLVDKYGMVDQCSFSSFDLPRLKELRDLRPQRDSMTGKHVYQTGALFDDTPFDFLKQAMDVGADEIHLRYDECTPERIACIHALGMGSMAWLCGPVTMTSYAESKYLDVGNEDEGCFEILLRTGVQQVCVNKPDVVIGMRRKKEQAKTNIGPTPIMQGSNRPGIVIAAA